MYNIVIKPLFKVEQNLDAWWESTEWKRIKNKKQVCKRCGHNLSFIGKDSLDYIWLYCYKCGNVERKRREEL